MACSVTGAPPDGEIGRMSLRIGQIGTVRRQVTEALTAHALGNPGINVLATPCLAGLCDKAAAIACGDETRTRRVRVDIRHISATPLADEVEICAEIQSIAGERVVLRVTGHDSRNKIVSGSVERGIV